MARIVRTSASSPWGSLSTAPAVTMKCSVLDFTMGSGSTGVACVNTNRRFIGIELDDDYFNIAKQRIDACEKH